MAKSKGNYVTVTEASELLEVHPHTIRSWIHAGVLPAKRAGNLGRFLVCREDLDEALNYKPHAGRGRRREKDDKK